MMSGDGVLGHEETQCEGSVSAVSCGMRRGRGIHWIEWEGMRSGREDEG